MRACLLASYHVYICADSKLIFLMCKMIFASIQLHIATLSDDATLISTLTGVCNMVVLLTYHQCVWAHLYIDIVVIRLVRCVSNTL